MPSDTKGGGRIYSRPQVFVTAFDMRRLQQSFAGKRPGADRGPDGSSVRFNDSKTTGGLSLNVVAWAVAPIIWASPSLTARFGTAAGQTQPRARDIAACRNVPAPANRDFDGGQRCTTVALIEYRVGAVGRRLAFSAAGSHVIRTSVKRGEYPPSSSHTTPPSRPSPYTCAVSS